MNSFESKYKHIQIKINLVTIHTFKTHLKANDGFKTTFCFPLNPINPNLRLLQHL